jgi:teichuronic acid exporter
MVPTNHQASRTVVWSAIERFSVQGIQMILTIVIARVLMPSDYGLIAMLNIFMALAQTFIDSGFSNALIQKKDTTNIDYSTVFYFNIAISVGIYAIMYLASPYIAAFYNEPPLDKINKIFSLVIIINSFGIVQQAKLTIELNFKRQAHASLLAVIISGIIGVWMAYNGFGVWAIVWQSVINAFLRVVFLWIFAHWMPMMAFSKHSFHILFAFGSKLLFSSLLHTLYVNIYTLIIGKVFSADTCGLYNQSFKLSTFPSTNLAAIIVRAIYPIQCRMQDENEKLRMFFLKYLRVSCYVIFPIMTAFAGLAKPFVLVFLGAHWVRIVPLLQILCIAYMWDPMMKLDSTLLQVKGRSDIFFHAEIVKKIIAFIILIVTIPFGITVMCYGLILYSISDIIIINIFNQKVINIPLLTQVKEILPILLTSALIFGVTFVTSYFMTSQIMALVIGVIESLAIYAIVSKTFMHKELSLLLNLRNSFK